MCWPAMYICISRESYACRVAGCCRSPNAGYRGGGMKRKYALLIFGIALSTCSARTVTDELGRVVMVPEHPHRIICLLPSVVDDVFALGAGADVIAVTDFTKYPPEAKSRPSVGLPLSPSMETILTLHPDLVLGTGDLNTSDTTKQLEGLGIAVFLVAPHGVEAIYHSIASLGQLLNRDESAKNLIEKLR